MYAALSALSNRLGPKPQPIRPPVANDRLRAHLFNTAKGAGAIVWSQTTTPRLRLSPGITAHDIMGNAISGLHVQITATPIYLLAKDARALRATVTNP